MALGANESVTAVLQAFERGDSSARDRLLPLVYEELRKIAHAKMAHEPAGHTLQATALVHEAYVRLVGDRAAWQSRGQFFAAASLAMRRILVDRARRVKAEKRGGGRSREEFLDAPEDLPADGKGAQEKSVDLVALDGALTALAQLDPRLAEVVHLRFFAGLSVEQAAEVTGASERTVKRDWAFARAWLHDKMTEAD